MFDKLGLFPSVRIQNENSASHELKKLKTPQHTEEQNKHALIHFLSTDYSPIVFNTITNHFLLYRDDKVPESKLIHPLLKFLRGRYS